MLFIKEEQVNFFSDQPEINNDDMMSKLADNQQSEGRLAIDVYKQNDNIIVRSTIAGAKIDDLEIIIDNDMLTICGKRTEPDTIDYLDYLYRECFWGNFSRSIILPVAINEDEISADLDNGVLTITLPVKKHD